MKKKNLKSLKLNKKSISNIQGRSLNGGSTFIINGCGPVSISFESCQNCTFDNCGSIDCVSENCGTNRYCDSDAPPI
jgi:hypothetical protein